MAFNIFRSGAIELYAGKWQVKDSRKFTEEELGDIDHAVVVASDYGNSVCFYLKNGYQGYIPLSDEATIGVGQTVDPTQCTIVTLTKPGHKDIERVVI